MLIKKRMGQRCVDWPVQIYRNESSFEYLAVMKLFYREAGEGQPLIILHGLFGSSDNWFTLSKTFAERFRVLTVDQRNHGQSPHDAEHNYEALTADLEALVDSLKIERPILMGHSMGGKTVMNFAVKHPNVAAKIVVVDMMPKAYPIHHDHIVEGLQAIDLATLRSRGEADQLLAHHIAEPDVRQFLLKNLTRSEHGFAWRINLPVLAQNIGAMVGDMVFSGVYNGPALFIKGARSNYYKPGDETRVNQLFPKAQWATLDTGHWVQAEKPREFADTVLQFLNA
jgi:esterase